MPLIQIGGIDFTRIDTNQQHPLGIEVEDRMGNVRKYVRAGAAIAAGDFLKCDIAEGVNDFDPTAAVNDVIRGLAERAVGDNLFFWMLIKGTSLIAKSAVGAAVGNTLGASAVAGTGAPLACAGANPTAAEAATYIAAIGGVKVSVIVAEAAGVAGVVLN